MIRLPEPGVLLAPVAVGVALSAACIAAAFQDDVLGGSFGWRQPLGLLSAAAIVIGVMPGIAAVGCGRWRMPTLTLTSVLGQLPENPPEGDYRILWIGDPQVMPVPPWTLAPGIGYAVTDDGPLTQYETWPGRPSKAEARGRPTSSARSPRSRRCAAAGCWRRTRFATSSCRSSTGRSAPSTIRCRCLAGCSTRSTTNSTSPRRSTRPLNFVVYENTAWIPTRAQFSAADADATRQAGMDSLAKLELRPIVTPVAVGAGDNADANFGAQPGVVTVATGIDSRWTLDVGGQSIAPRPAFGVTTGYDVATAGPATLHYHTAISRAFLLIGAAAAVVAAGARRQPVRHGVDRAVAAPAQRRRAGGAAPVDRRAHRPSRSSSHSDDPELGVGRRSTASPIEAGVE